VDDDGHAVGSAAWQSPSTALASHPLLFGGVRSLLCCRLVWLYWISPMSWAIRSLAQNEFNDESYGRDGDRIAGMRAGDFYLTQCVNV
jgi:hypothetical protein